MSRLHWIEWPGPGRLATAARPRADDWLDDAIRGWKEEGVDIVVSMLAPSEVQDLGLQREAELCRANGVAFISFPIPDYGVPDNRQEVLRLAQSLAAKLRDGQSIVTHCRAGIGRSSLIAACTLICSGIDAADALALIAAARGMRVPDTDAQRDWVMGIGGDEIKLQE